MKPLSISIPQVCAIVGIGRSKVYQLIRCKSLDAIKIGTRTFITVESVERLIETSKLKID